MCHFFCCKYLTLKSCMCSTGAKGVGAAAEVKGKWEGTFTVHRFWMQLLASGAVGQRHYLCRRWDRSDTSSFRNLGGVGQVHWEVPSGYITPAVWGVPNTSKRGTKSEVAHKWADWLHNPRRLGNRQCYAQCFAGCACALGALSCICMGEGPCLVHVSCPVLP